MHRRAAAVIILAAVAAGLAASALGAQPKMDRVRGIVESAARVFLDHPHAAGLSIGILQGDEARSFHFGRLDPARSTPPDDRTLYAIASITKTFTGTLLAMASREHKLRLDADVRDYLPGSYPGLEFQGHPILVHQLVSHRSGLPFVLPDTPPDQADAVLRGQTRDAFFEQLHLVRLTAIPGQAFRYSNAGGQLAGFVLERVYGEPYAQLIAHRVAAPLGLRDTTIVLSRDERRRLATGYDGEGHVAPAVPDELQGAGALKSTLADMLRYARWHLAEQDPAVVLSHTPTLTDGNYAVGLNWQMLTVVGRRLIWQEGHVPGFLSYCVLVPDLRLGVVVLTNAEDAQASPRAAAMINGIMRALDAGAPALP
jgi:D-alanyl-D-alanine-carboxypeptidase/D-alanyl-D-alanine-endopeptidase